MKTLIIDYKKWRCGFTSFDRKIRHGQGGTFPRNSKGYMCCLGFFTCQLSNLKYKDILEEGQPENIDKKIALLTKNSPDGIVNTHFSMQAMDINDDIEITIEQKIIKLRALCKRHGYKLQVKNLPASIKHLATK